VVVLIAPFFILALLGNGDNGAGPDNPPGCVGLATAHHRDDDQRNRLPAASLVVCPRRHAQTSSENHTEMAGTHFQAFRRIRT